MQPLERREGLREWKEHVDGVFRGSISNIFRNRGSKLEGWQWARWERLLDSVPHGRLGKRCPNCLMAESDLGSRKGKERTSKFMPTVPPARIRPT